MTWYQPIRRREFGAGRLVAIDPVQYPGLVEGALQLNS